MLLFYLLMVMTGWVDAQHSDEELLVAIPTLGQLRGSYLLSQSGRSFRAFRAIPYAKPPTGELRFKVKT